MLISATNRRVWAANNTELVIDGEVVVPFWLNGRCISTKALISPEECLIFADWLQAHKCLWDFTDGKL